MVFVIFGASGDLSQRKLLPALANLKKQDMLDKDIKILAIGRRDYSTSQYLDIAKNNFEKFNIEADNELYNLIEYYKMDIQNSDDYIKLKKYLSTISHNIIYYFAIAPTLYSSVAINLNLVELTNEREGFKRVIVEKPFGRDLASFKKINKELHKSFKEHQIFRIDHYLGKETVQNILVTRFGNAIFEPLWNRNYIDYVEIIASESLSVGTRTGYYDKAGALRDMLQNHLLQVLSLVAMEPPVNSESNNLKNEMEKVYKSLRAISYDEVGKYVVRGQYDGYKDEKGVNKDSITETYVALKCYLDNYRWSGVPFYIRTGKKLPISATEIIIHFKENPHKIFCTEECIHSPENSIVIRVQPKEGIFVNFGMKIPGAGFKVQPVSMDFYYSSLTKNYIPKAYERLIYDCINNDSTLYQRSSALELTWSYVQPIIDAFAKNDLPIYSYKEGDCGPKEAEINLCNINHTWHNPNLYIAKD